MAQEPPEREVGDEPPPFLVRWRRVYAVVVAWLAGVIGLIYLFSRIFNR
jgi:hypothetical protein